MRRAKKNKAKCQIQHAKKRALERTGFHIGDERLKQWVILIQNGEAEFIDRQSNRLTRWFIDYQKEKIPVVYDKQRKTIVTVLTPEMIEG